MKDNLFEMLLNLFEKTLTQLKENHELVHADDKTEATMHALPLGNVQAMVTQSCRPDSVRVFTYDEQIKLTKASYQFLVRLSSWDIIPRDVLELVINQLIFSDSRFVSLQETKWTIRNTLANKLDAEQLAFLDLVLYHKEDKLSLH